MQLNIHVVHYLLHKLFLSEFYNICIQANSQANCFQHDSMTVYCLIIKKKMFLFLKTFDNSVFIVVV